ncbi:uncharacterized protein C2845_PM15G15970 [Panicum miliaceum]|uniref:Uncharacterized protein n=1 Tax=Panicum miliaceum TaxID=4540 RepID=A0A3L6Q5T7_PANMI|nr:uncharacterized protein C2845_PM15G15970 [Panicum miliaceum]
MRSVYVGAEFRNMYQGDMSVHSYCTKMKSLADHLTDLGARITDHDLVLNIIRGINTKYYGSIPVLTRGGLPTFLETRSHLLMEEHRIAQGERNARAAALLAQAPGAVPYFGLVAQCAFQSPPALSAPHSPSTGKKQKYKKKGSTSGASSSTTGRPQASASSTLTPPAAGMNPWGGMFQAWPMLMPRPPASGILGPRPVSVPQAHYGTPAPSSAIAPTTPAWDQTALINALNAMTLCVGPERVVLRH